MPGQAWGNPDAVAFSTPHWCFTCSGDAGLLWQLDLEGSQVSPASARAGWFATHTNISQDLGSSGEWDPINPHTQSQSIPLCLGSQDGQSMVMWPAQPPDSLPDPDSVEDQPLPTHQDADQGEDDLQPHQHPDQHQYGAQLAHQPTFRPVAGTDRRRAEAAGRPARSGLVSADLDGDVASQRAQHSAATPGHHRVSWSNKAPRELEGFKAWCCYCGSGFRKDELIWRPCVCGGPEHQRSLKRGVHARDGCTAAGPAAASASGVTHGAASATEVLASPPAAAPFGSCTPPSAGIPPPPEAAPGAPVRPPRSAAEIEANRWEALRKRAKHDPEIRRRLQFESAGANVRRPEWQG
ncbi:hypothetical protein WJX72_011859 [[Myrmecia] bisecta]|uniref:Uncharacterized protein n=1 Tax=[Myrmecia] bisecta TaxID=41462 RepID=A0AAW1QT59_9CHLO